MDFLASLFGKPKIDSEEQLRQAQAVDYSQYDQEAKRNGFNNGEEYILWLKQRERKTGGTVPAGKSKGSAGASVDAAMALHPSYLLNYVANKLKMVNER